MCEYMKILLAGLAGSPHMMSATVLAVGRVAYEFKDKLDSSLIHMLLENNCLLLTSKSREVVESALSFFKVLFSTLDTSDLAQHVEYLVKSITSISEDNQRHFRFKAKELFTRLVRKFGYEMISKLVPEHYEKQLTNIRKTEARKARKKDAKDIDDDDSEYEVSNQAKGYQSFDAILADSEDEMPLEFETSKRQKTSNKKMRKSEAMIEEHGEDDIVDFMDPAVNKRLLTAKPEKISIKRSDESFPVAEDGRFIITDEDVTEVKKKEEKEKDERKEILTELGAMQKKNKNKRKYEESDDDMDDDEIGKTYVSKGIHRTIGPNTKGKTPGAQFKAKKAGGDVKKGKLDPYAYVPFNKQFLNKRKQVKMKGQFKGIVKGAKKGANVGIKRKMKEARRRKNK